MAGAGAGAGDRHHRRLDVVVTACSTEEDAAAECRVLRPRVPGVQRLAGMTECGKGIVTTPLAEPLANRRGLGGVLQAVVTTLEQIHALNLQLCTEMFPRPTFWSPQKASRWWWMWEAQCRGTFPYSTMAL